MKDNWETNEYFNKEDIIISSKIEEKNQNEFILPLELNSKLMNEESMPNNINNNSLEKNYLDSKRLDLNLEFNIANKNLNLQCEHNNQDPYNKLETKPLVSENSENVNNFIKNKIEETISIIPVKEDQKNDGNQLIIHKGDESIVDSLRQKDLINKNNQAQVQNIQTIPKVDINIPKVDLIKESENIKTESFESVSMDSKEESQKKSEPILLNNFIGNNIKGNLESNIVEELKSNEIRLDNNKNNLKKLNILSNIYDEYLQRFEDKEKNNLNEVKNKIVLEAEKVAKQSSPLDSKNKIIGGLNIMDIF